MSVLDVNINEYIPDIIDAYSEVLGEQYREVIKERITKTKNIFYNNQNGINSYYDFLKECKKREVFINFLKKIKVDVSKFNTENYSEDFDKDLKDLLNIYFGDVDFLIKYDVISTTEGINAFDINSINTIQNKNTDRYSNLYRDIAIEERVKFLEFLRKDKENLVTMPILDYASFSKTDEYYKLLSIINVYLDVYYMLLEEKSDIQRRIDKCLEDLNVEWESEDNKDIIAHICNNDEFVNNFNSLSDKEKESFFEIYSNGESKLVKEKAKADTSPILYFTITSGQEGNLDYSYLKELGQVINNSDIDEILSKNLIEIFAKEAKDILHQKDKFILEPKQITKSNIPDKTNGIIKEMLLPLVKTHRKTLIETLITGNKSVLENEIGKENFRDLIEIVNEVNSLIEDGLLKQVDRDNLMSLIKFKYDKQRKKLGDVYKSIETYNIEKDKKVNYSEYESKRVEINNPKVKNSKKDIGDFEGKGDR